MPTNQITHFMRSPEARYFAAHATLSIPVQLAAKQNLAYLAPAHTRSLSNRLILSKKYPTTQHTRFYLF
jgi:hypothetical protein